MEKVGMGGFFFRARDPESLAKRYLDRLGINLVPGDYDTLPWSAGVVSERKDRKVPSCHFQAEQMRMERSRFRKRASSTGLKSPVHVQITARTKPRPPAGTIFRQGVADA